MSLPEIILLPGWGFSSNIMEAFSKKLNYSSSIIDIEPYFQKSSNAEEIAYKISDLIKRPCHILGWSLGGMLAKLITSHSKHILSCTMLSSQDSFIRRDQTPGIATENLHALKKMCEKNHTKAFAYFLKLQHKSPMRIKSIIKSLGETPWAKTSLLNGLSALEKLDLRSIQPSQPLLRLSGDQDPLTLNLNKQIIVEDAGHLSFLTHPQRTVEIIHDFLPQ